MRFESTINDKTTEITLNGDNDTAIVDGSETTYQFSGPQNGRYLLRIGHKLYTIDNVSKNGKTVEFTLDGKWVTSEVKTDQDLLLEKLGFKTDTAASAGTLNAPMPGRILELLVAEGDEVELGDPIAILEAMKMENELKAPISGTIASITVSENTNVEKNQLLLEIEPRG